MSYSVDVNLLLYASDRSSPHHQRAQTFLERCAHEPEVLCLAWPTLMGYLRIATHPSIFAEPLTVEEARGNIAELLQLPHCRAVSEGDGFWQIYRVATRGLVPRGNLVPDSHLAAILLQHEVRTLYTADTDFRRFTFLDVRNPLDPAATSSSRPRG